MEHIIKILPVIIAVLIVKLALALNNYVQVAKTLLNLENTVVLVAVKDLQAVRCVHYNSVLNAMIQLNLSQLQ